MSDRNESLPGDDNAPYYRDECNCVPANLRPAGVHEGWCGNTSHPDAHNEAAGLQDMNPEAPNTMVISGASDKWNVETVENRNPVYWYDKPIGEIAYPTAKIAIQSLKIEMTRSDGKVTLDLKNVTITGDIAFQMYDVAGMLDGQNVDMQ